MKRVYIAGPMTGIPQFNFPAFDAARDRWSAAGWEVVSPADMDREWWRAKYGTEFDVNNPDPRIIAGGDIYDEWLRLDIAQITRCTAIALLPGWEKSKGVAKELAVARMLKLAELDAITFGPVVVTAGKKDFDGEISGDGYKQSMDNPAKVPLTLVPPVFVRGIAQVLQFGAKKYARGQWMRGMSFSEVLDALKRHTEGIENGEELDRDSGLPHEYHIGCCAAFLSWYRYGPRAKEYRRFDDRLYAPEYHRQKGVVVESCARAESVTVLEHTSTQEGPTGFDDVGDN